MTNCKAELDLSWSKDCIIPEISITPGIVGDPDAIPTVHPRVAIQTTGVTSWINNAILYMFQLSLCLLIITSNF